jgi:hypothetical protein
MLTLILVMSRAITRAYLSANPRDQTLSHEVDMSEIERTTDAEKYLPARLVRRRYGDISAMSLHRWLADNKLSFPKPIYFGRNRFWRLRDLIEWESRQPRKLKVEAA